MSNDWSDDDEQFLRKKWIDGWADAQIGASLPVKPRSAKAVEWHRRSLGLLSTNYPERRKTTNRRAYSRAEERDILARAKKGEKTASIARSYGISTEAMGQKIGRLRANDGISEPTPRPCIHCRKEFMSIHPKSVHRQCASCERIINENGACMLTVFL